MNPIKLMIHSKIKKSPNEKGINPEIKESTFDNIG